MSPPSPLQLPDARDVENQLVHLLDFDKFELIKELLRNATRIVWCMRLARAQVGGEAALGLLCCPLSSGTGPVCSVGAAFGARRWAAGRWAAGLSCSSPAGRQVVRNVRGASGEMGK